MRWLPFQLNPDLPESGIPRAEYIQRKWGARGNTYSRVAGVGATVGIPFAFDKIEVQPNTLMAHRLLHFAEQQARQDEVSEELFRAYFIEGANLTDAETLADVATRAGLDRKAVLAYLASDADRELVAAADIDARNGGIGGVPFFIFNRKIGVSGAQDPEVLLQAMEQGTAMPMDERASGWRLSARTRRSSINCRNSASATMTMSATSPRISRFGMDLSPVPTDVVAVTIVFFVSRSSSGINARYAAVNAPEVITTKSFAGAATVHPLTGYPRKSCPFAV